VSVVVDPAELEPVAARAWRAADESAVGGWRLYASAGYSGRINACWPLAAPDRPLAEAVTATEVWYTARGLAPVFKIVDEAAWPEGLIDHLETLGYRPHTETVMMVGPLLGEADPSVLMSDDLDAAFEDVFVVTGHAEPADVRERLEALGRIVPPRGFARVDVGGAPVAIGAVAVEGQWAGIFGMRTTPEHRRRGLAWMIFSALTAKARSAGATRGYLQVEAANAGAIALYARAGFAEAYRYSYWARP
jgi:GNAT superfamily N-acetyltransferase